MKFATVAFALACMLFASCSKNKEQQIAETAERYMQFLEDGLYDSLVVKTIGCQNASNSYKETMNVRYKMMAEELHNKLGQLKAIKCTGIDGDINNGPLDVRMQLTSQNDERQNFLLHLVCQDGLWFIQ